jgi:hypothetical protein
MSSHAQRLREITLRSIRAPSVPPPSAQNPPRIGQEVMNSAGIALTWNGMCWRPPEAQIGVISDIIGGPRLLRPSDDRPLTNVAVVNGSLWFDSVGLQQYTWFEPPGQVGEWILSNNTTGEATITSDQVSILGDGTTTAPIYVNIVAGVQY